ncbi:MAG: tRNA epoxyqueuosine(34) reductase QueG [Fimbriimonadaceae bacterium]|nr:tRNA epoxyqueuosine(34) reductase QueG [Fimbriimonadaceae bacterium]
MNPSPTEDLKEQARALGFEPVGVCDAVPAPHQDAYETWLAKGYHGTMGYLARSVALRAHPAMLLTGVRSVVAVGMNYHRPNPVIAGRPRVARYALGRDYHRVLRGKLRRLATWVEEEFPGATTRVCVDSAPIFEREYAHRAGLGWFGKNTMLIDSRRGSWFVIGILLTDVHFRPDRPALGGCGSCRRCVDACPTGAIVFEEHRWQLDARRCVSYLTIEHRGEIEPGLEAGVGDWTFGCDVCQEVCPFNEPRATQPLRAAETTEPDFLRTTDLPDLKELALLDEPAWDAATRGSPIRRAGLDGLRRNARVNLRNAKRGQ